MKNFLIFSALVIFFSAASAQRVVVLEEFTSGT